MNETLRMLKYDAQSLHKTTHIFSIKKINTLQCFLITREITATIKFQVQRNLFLQPNTLIRILKLFGLIIRNSILITLTISKQKPYQLNMKIIAH